MQTTSQAEIQHHYDLSNDFYALWLDARMVYSAGLWTSEDQTLEEAQVEKLRFHADAAGVQPGSRVLDIGCGWGAFLRWAVRERGAREAVGLTLSDAQKTYFEERSDAENARVVVQNWQNYLDPEPFDAIVSIGAFEHFGRYDQSGEERRAVYAQFFDFCRRRLKRGGKVSLQTIAYGRIRRLTPFLREKIWRESELPLAFEILEAAARGFAAEMLVDHAAHYARTLREWQARLVAARARAETLVGPERFAEYIQYLEDSALGFESGGVQLLRIAFRRY